MHGDDFACIFAAFDSLDSGPDENAGAAFLGVEVDALRAMGERARFSKGLYAWIGFRSKGVPFDVAQRASGTSKFNARKLFRFAFDGIAADGTHYLPPGVYTIRASATDVRDHSVTASGTFTMLERVVTPGTRRDEASRLWLRIKGHAQELPVSRAYVHRFKAM